MNATIDDGYFHWLYNLVENNPRHSRSHWSLLSQLHAKPFRWFVANDDNRNEDGRELRGEFLDQFNIYEADNPWLDMDASVLEMLIALARRAAFEASGDPEDWFWKLLENLELAAYTDHIHHNWEQAIDEVLEQFLDRRYGREGGGGLFPLRDPQQDQRRVEIWYQLSSYLLEGNDVTHGR